MKSFKQHLYEKRQECDLISYQALKRVEKKLNALFDRYEVEFNFTRHFADRMSDDRNDPCISMQDLASVFNKIYKNRAKRVKSDDDFQAVIRDISSDINIPIAVKYDKRNDEFDVSLKTIMRKKNFKTPNKVIGYK